MNQLENIQPCADWEEYLLCDVANTTSGGTPNRSKKEFYEGEIPWVKSGELNDNFIYGTEEHISEDGLKKSSAKLFPSGTLLMAMYGATVGKTAILKIEAATNQAVCGIFPNQTKANTDFLRYQLVFFREKLLSERYGGAQPNISQTIIKNIQLRLPTLLEQCRIAYVLSTVQTAIEQQSRLIKLTRELKSALMHKLFTEGLHGEKQKMTEIGPVPESWKIEPFEKFTILQRGKDLTKVNFKNGRVPVAGSNGVIGYNDVAFVKAPGVTVGRSGSVGKVTFYDQDFWAHNTSLYVKDFHGNDPRFAAYYLEVLEIGRFKTGASVPTLDRNSFKHLPIAVPPKDEQIEIGNNLSEVDKKIEITVHRKAILEELFRTLLNQLMTGQTRVNDIDLPGFSGG
jgi:type I restriction enzyme S subunit